MKFSQTVNGMDYITLDVMLEFDACESRKCLNVSIVDDSVDERNEYFTFHLRRTVNLHNRISLNPANGSSLILDNDGRSHNAYI